MVNIGASKPSSPRRVRASNEVVAPATTRPVDLFERIDDRRVTLHGGEIRRWPQKTELDGLGTSAGKIGDSRPFEIGGQAAWFHDEGHAYGFFHTFDALALPGSPPRRVHVFLPRDYETSGRRYPVVYMNDGNTAFFPGGAGNKSWKVGEALSALAAEATIEPVIVVAVWPLNRGQEYTPGAAQPGEMRAAQYASYLADSVKPFIDRTYPTDPDPRRTSIVGSSHGGLISFITATERPDAFGAAGVLSPSFWRGLDRLENDVGSGGLLDRSALVHAARPTLTDRTRRPKLWIDWGLVRDGGFHNSNIEKHVTRRAEEMVDLLSGDELGYRVGVDLFAVEDAAGEHDENAWARRFPGLMQAFYPPR